MKQWYGYTVHNVFPKETTKKGLQQFAKEISDLLTDIFNQSQ